MQRVKLDSFKVSGVKTRTNNKNEMKPEDSKIALLWNNFYQNKLPEKLNSNEIYGVYYNYESDVNGNFDVLAGLKVDNKDFESINIEKGEYLVFSKKGTMPQAVIDTWSEVWNYFNSNPKEKRAYKTDFEKYISDNEVEVYIGIL